MRSQPVVGAGRIGFLEWKRANQSDGWLCPKYNDYVSQRTCQCRERDFGSSEYGGIDCRECPHQLKLQRAKRVHKDDWSNRKVALWRIGAILVDLALLGLVIWGLSKLF